MIQCTGYVKKIIENYFIINRKFITYVFKNINWYSYQIIVYKENPFLISKRPALKKKCFKKFSVCLPRHSYSCLSLEPLYTCKKASLYKYLDQQKKVWNRL